MAMNFAPLDCSCQGAFSERFREKNLPGFFRFREIHLNAHSSLVKKQKIHLSFLAPTRQKMGSMGGTFIIPEFNSCYTYNN
jgi:hypothetical protein